MKTNHTYRTIKVIFCTLIITALVGCATTMIEPSAIDVPNNLSSAQVSKAIRKALLNRGWTITSHEDDTFVAKLHSSNWKATIKIPYNDSKVQLIYGGSQGLDYHKENGEVKINRHWNDWMHYLNQDINRYLANMATK